MATHALVEGILLENQPVGLVQQQAGYEQATVAQAKVTVTRLGRQQRDHAHLSGRGLVSWERPPE